MSFFPFSVLLNYKELERKAGASLWPPMMIWPHLPWEVQLNKQSPSISAHGNWQMACMAAILFLPSALFPPFPTFWNTLTVRTRSVHLQSTHTVTSVTNWLVTTGAWAFVNSSISSGHRWFKEKIRYAFHLWAFFCHSVKNRIWSWTDLNKISPVWQNQEAMPTGPGAIRRCRATFASLGLWGRCSLLLVSHSVIRCTCKIS